MVRRWVSSMGRLSEMASGGGAGSAVGAGSALCPRAPGVMGAGGWTAGAQAPTKMSAIGRSRMFIGLPMLWSLPRESRHPVTRVVVDPVGHSSISCFFEEVLLTEFSVRADATE